MILVDANAARSAAPRHPLTNRPNRVHIDITPNDGIDPAIEQNVRLGGRQEGPQPVPRPGSYGDDAPFINWAVMQDRFGNEFCLVPLSSRRQPGWPPATAPPRTTPYVPPPDRPQR